VIRIRKIDRECIRARWLVFFVQFSSSFFRAGLGALDLARSSDFYFSTSALWKFQGRGGEFCVNDEEEEEEEEIYIYINIYISYSQSVVFSV